MTPQSPNDPDMPPRGGFHPEDRTPTDAYQAPDDRPGAGKSSKSWVWIIGIVAAVLVGGAVICCGGGVLLFNYAADQVATQVRAEIADHPAIQEHIGEIETLELSVREAAELDEPDRIVLIVEGSKGDGLIIGDQAMGSQGPSNLVADP